MRNKDNLEKPSMFKVVKRQVDYQLPTTAEGVDKNSKTFCEKVYVTYDSPENSLDDTLISKTC